ncbi:PREDICTED: WAP four-disulfide core domain protein 12 [Dipodomys ordii]|uniref:WAP four-disulfide core domain protein 12 n=1 Tax=Dipodomys ordii TaxID=10020 RepID=A0A1S3EP78_DIPOR|nr:PREDICTED: WAP four-disulfide core domain protein 12 [Dipodomys ordii]
MRAGSFLGLIAILLFLTLVAGEGVSEGIEKSGVCPGDDIMALEGKSTPVSHTDCAGDIKCCRFHCGFTCIQPVRTLDRG